MIKKLLSLIVMSALCLPLFASTNVMKIKLKDGQVFKYNVEDVEEATFVDIPEESIPDTSELTLKFEITSDSTVKVIGDNCTIFPDTLSVPSKVLIEGKEYSVTAIGSQALEGVEYSTVIFPSSVTVFEQVIFSDYSTVKTIVLSEGVTSIGKQAFFACHNLIDIHIPSSVTSIGDQAFYACDSLASINIPSNVSDIGKKVFDDCTSLTTINVSAENPNFSAMDGILYDKNKTEIILVSTGIRGDIVLPSSLKSIKNHAFFN